jgi:AcrR family transcriptional regulator
VPRPSKPLLSRRGIAVEALALVDEEGIEGLTTRRLAKRLGVEGPSLYNHVAGREALLDEMTALIDEQVDTSLLDDPDWRVGLPAFARSYRQAFAAHPHIVATVSARPVNTDTALRAYDHAFAAFERFGWDGHTASVVMAAIDFLVLGSAIETFKGGFDRPAAEYAPDYPHLASALRAAGDDDIDTLGFELGLAALVAWLSARERERA